jgi:hypothetical protein
MTMDDDERRQKGSEHEQVKSSRRYLRPPSPQLILSSCIFYSARRPLTLPALFSQVSR